MGRRLTHGESSHTWEDFLYMGSLPMYKKTSHTWEVLTCMGSLPTFGKSSEDFPYTGAPQYVGMHTHMLGSPSAWECIPTYIYRYRYIYIYITSVASSARSFLIVRLGIGFRPAAMRTMAAKRKQEALSGLDTAFALERRYVDEKLQQDHELTFTIASLMRAGTLRDALKGAQNKGKKQQGMLRPSQKKFSSLTMPVVKKILAAGKPDVFTQEFLEDTGSEEDLFGMMYFALGVNATSSLPLETYPQTVYITSLIEVCVARCQQIGFRMQEWANPERISGYFVLTQKEDGTLVVQAALGMQHEIPWPFPGFGIADINWRNFYTQAAEMYIGTGRRACVPKLDFQEFVPDLLWDDESEAWEIPGIVADEPPFDEDSMGSPASTTTAPSATTASASGSSSSSGVRRRLEGSGGFAVAPVAPPS